jgi:hypothetical protein
MLLLSSHLWGAESLVLLREEKTNHCNSNNTKTNQMELGGWFGGRERGKGKG